TRVGAGPFPTELDNEFGESLRKAGGEFGTTTGRPRRTGWLDLVQLKYAARINGFSHLCITKLDVLSGLGDLKLCTSYRTHTGAELDDFPYHQSVVHHLEPVYTTMPGWDEDLTKVRSKEDLPQTAIDYLAFIGEFIEVPVTLVGVGPARDQIIEL
ncbi:MAG: adenylosuccinate synthetase, partial [Solirubrobacteraceae bacterium]|nr:adenylosuccinate synthetase [Solirubrobacteraceae bacterium]